MLKKSLVGLLVVLFVATSLAWFVDFDATALGRTALRQTGASTGIQLEASEYRINLIRGLELDNVEASTRFPGGRYAITMPAMRLQHRLASLLGGRLEVERVVLVQPRVAITTGLEPERTSSASPSEQPRRRRERSETPVVDVAPSSVELRVSELALSGAAFSYNDELSLEGVDVLLRSPTLSAGALTLLHRVAATGDLSIQNLSFRTETVQNIAARIELSGGRVDLVDGVFETSYGTFQSAVHLDFNSIPVRHRLSLTARVTGVPGEVSFEGEGFGLDAANVKGEGAWIVSTGQFDDSPLWRSLGLTGSEYEPTEVPLRVAEGRIVLEGEWIRGSIGLDGELDLIVNGVEVGGTWNAPVRR